MKTVGGIICIFFLSIVGCNNASPVGPYLVDASFLSRGSSGASGPAGGAIGPQAGGVETPIGSGGAEPASGGSGGDLIVDSGTPDTDIQPPIDSGSPDGNGVVSTGGTNGGAAGSGPLPPAANDPVIPQVEGDCPGFVNGPLNFMGLSGQIVAGAKGSGDGALLFYWHGTVMNSGEYFMIGANATRITSAGGVIVSIQGPASGEGGGMCSGTFIFGDGVTWDIVDQITACAVRDHNINPRRIYATGCSAGGLQSGCMASRRSSYVAAVATNSGGAVFFLPLQDPLRAPAAICAHGAPGVDVVAVDFSQTSRTFGNGLKAAGGFVVLCNHGGGHCGIPGNCYTAAFDFMFDHPFGTKPSPYASGGLPASFPSYCEIL